MVLLWDPQVVSMKNNGFSLIEILIATAILIAAMVPLWGLLGASHTQVTASTDEVLVSEIAVSIIEQIEKFNWIPDKKIISFTPKSGAAIDIGSSNKCNISFAKYPDHLKLTGTVKSKNFPASQTDSGKIVSIELNYKTKMKVGKAVKNYSISTFICRK